MLGPQMAAIAAVLHNTVDNRQGPQALSHLAWGPVLHSTANSTPLDFGNIENSHSCCNFDVTADQLRQAVGHHLPDRPPQGQSRLLVLNPRQLAKIGTVAPAIAKDKHSIKDSPNSTENIDYSSHDIIVAVIRNLLQLGHLKPEAAHSSSPKCRTGVEQGDHQVQDRAALVTPVELDADFSYCFTYLLFLHYFYDDPLVSYLHVWHSRHFLDSDSHTATSQ